MTTNMRAVIHSIMYQRVILILLDLKTSYSSDRQIMYMTEYIDLLEIIMCFSRSKNSKLYVHSRINGNWVRSNDIYPGYDFQTIWFYWAEYFDAKGEKVMIFYFSNLSSNVSVWHNSTTVKILLQPTKKKENNLIKHSLL